MLFRSDLITAQLDSDDSAETTVSVHDERAEMSKDDKSESDEGIIINDSKGAKAQSDGVDE